MTTSERPPQEPPRSGTDLLVEEASERQAPCHLPDRLVLFRRHRRRRRLLVVLHWQYSRIVTETASSTRVEVRLDHYGWGMDLRQAADAVVVIAVHTDGLGEYQEVDGAATAVSVWRRQGVRNTVVAVERRAQQVDRTAAVVPEVDTRLDV